MKYYVDSVERGKEIAAAKGEEYPPYLASIADRERARIATRKVDVELLNRQLGAGGDEGADEADPGQDAGDR